MAHAYTTKRGKNKKAKLGVRKDQQQNQERSLKHGVNLSAFLYDGPKESTVGVMGHLTGGSSSNSRLEDVRSRLQRAIADKCSNPACENAQSSQLSECAACRSVRYCCRECQKAHWPWHKDTCKQIRKELEKKEEENKLHVLQALEKLHLNSSADTNSAAPITTDALKDEAVADPSVEADKSDDEQGNDEGRDSSDDELD
jgi:hypothetical protein